MEDPITIQTGEAPPAEPPERLLTPTPVNLSIVIVSGVPDIDPELRFLMDVRYQV